MPLDAPRESDETPLRDRSSGKPVGTALASTFRLSLNQSPMAKIVSKKFENFCEPLLRLRALRASCAASGSMWVNRVPAGADRGIRQRFFGIFWPLFLAGSERLRDNRRMTDAAHNQHRKPAARAIATAS